MNVSVIGVGGVLTLGWAWPLYGLIYNRLSPSYESALGVPYTFLFGCAIHLLLMLGWMLGRRARLQRAEVLVLLVSFGVLVLLTVISDGGALSKVTA